MTISDNVLAAWIITLLWLSFFITCGEPDLHDAMLHNLGVEPERNLPSEVMNR